LAAVAWVIVAGPFHVSMAPLVTTTSAGSITTVTPVKETALMGGALTHKSG
jgi:hypothetical protein